jgi:hypothetical protein
MPRLSLWKGGRKTNDFRFLDKTINEYFKISGTSAFIYKYIGINDGEPSNVMKIQDFLFLENRDRKYDKNILELPTCYTVSDDDPELKQFGLFTGLNGIVLNFHLNSIVDLLGRKPMVGDVLELPHLRDMDLLDGISAFNKFFVVKNVVKPAKGYSLTWFPHLIALSCEPMTDSQETHDIVTRLSFDSYRLEEDSILRDIMSINPKLANINEKVVDEARVHVPLTNFETSQFYVIEGTDAEQYPWVFAGDGIPPNGAKLLATGDSFPTGAKTNSWVLRTDFEPPTLFKKVKSSWQRYEIDYRRTPSILHRLLQGFTINDNKTTLDDGTIIDEKQFLSKIGKK